ncbi:MAG: SurA N-terminal domain-containing protein [Candidatus Omnitrophota bacterium]
MFRKLRNKKVARKIWIVLAIVIIPAFCFWGVGSALRDRKESGLLAKVSGKTINTHEYVKNYKAVSNQYLIQLGQEQFRQLRQYLNLEAATWDRIVLLREAKKKRINIKNQEVVSAIKQYPFLQTEGKFNPVLYQEMITYVFGTTPREFEEEIRDNLIIARLFEEVTRDIAIEENEIKESYDKTREEISLEYIHASVDKFLDQVSLESQELLDYYNNNPEGFRKPLSYNLEYIEVDDENKEAIDKIAEMLKQNSSLQEAAKNTGLIISETGLFSIDEPIPKIGWSTEILKIISKLKAQGNPWPQPIQSDTKIVYFISLKEEKQSFIPPFDHVKEGVKQALRREKSGRKAEETLQTCYQEGIVDFTESAEKFGLESGQTELFKRRSYVEGLGDSNLFFEAVENLQKEEISQIINTASGFYIVKLKERVRPAEEKFEEEKEGFAANLLEEKKQNYFTEFIAELKSRPNTFIHFTK